MREVTKEEQRIHKQFKESLKTSLDKIKALRKGSLMENLYLVATIEFITGSTDKLFHETWMHTPKETQLELRELMRVGLLYSLLQLVNKGDENDN